MLSLILVLLVIDQQSKVIAQNLLANNIQLPFLTLVHNKGIAYGLFAGHINITIILSLIVLSGILLLRKQLFGTTILSSLSFIFILSGGIGNLLDRILRGYVIDFINIQIIPVFNFADIYINIGIFLLLINFFIYEWKHQN